MELTLDKNIQVLRWAFVKQTTKVVDGLLIAACPFLATPGLKQVMDTFLGWIIGKLATDVEMQVFFRYTDIRVSAEGREFIASYQKFEDAKASGTAEEKAAAEAAMFHNFRNLVMWKA